MYANGIKVKEANISLPNKYNFNLILLFVKKMRFQHIHHKPTKHSLMIWHQSFLLRVITQVLIFEREWWHFCFKKRTHFNFNFYPPYILNQAMRAEECLPLPLSGPRKPVQGLDRGRNGRPVKPTRAWGRVGSWEAALINTGFWQMSHPCRHLPFASF